MSQHAQIYESFLSKAITDSLIDLKTSTAGLNQADAAIRLAEHGLNTIKARQVSWSQILLRQFKSPFIYLLLAASLLAFMLGELIDGLMVLLFVTINAVLGFYQEYRSEQALKVLKKYTTAHAKVIRENQELSISVEQLVPGDIVKLLPGDVVPADLRIIEAANLQINESVLTGESEPAVKSNAIVADRHVPIHQASNIAFSATNVISGQGTGVVIAAGSLAYIGTIAKLTVETHQVSSFEKGMGKFSAFVLRLVALTLITVLIANMLINPGTSSLVELIIFSIALATAVIPEALPVVITFSLSRGAARLAKHKVVVKRLSAIEDLGGIQVLCTDKTGTITENKLTAIDYFGIKSKVLTYANYAISEKSHHKDPFDTALEAAIASDQSFTKKPINQEMPFDPERKRNSVIIQEGNRPMLIVRGAAESILPYVAESTREEVETWIKQQELNGRRVIVIAHKRVHSTKIYNRLTEQSSLTLTGAISFTDPLKKTTAAAVNKAQKLGVSIKIITGDSPIVAGAVAKEIGLVSDQLQVMTAKNLFKLSPAKQRQAAEEYQVFARFSPHEKHQLIDLLQHKYEVGFLGEGINDAPALKSANVALVVQGASDIAREAADVILLNPSLNVIIDGIQEGREVFANTIKYVKMTLASNFGNFYAVAIASLIIDYLPMLPIQILLVNLLSDFPLIAIATDSVDHAEIKSPEIYNLKDFALIATVIGIVSTFFDFIYFALFYKISPEVLQTNWFMGSILTELALLYSLRSRLPFFKAKFPPLTIIILTAVAAFAAIIIPYTSLGQNIFKFYPPSILHLAIILGVAVAYFISTESVKLLYYRLFKSETVAVH